MIEKKEKWNWLKKKENNKGNRKISRVDTIVGSSAELNGNIFLKDKGIIRIDGRLHGDISGADSIIIGKTGFIEGDIIAGTILVGGKVTGNISASQDLEMFSSAIVKGDIKYSHLLIEEGAIFEGNCKRVDGNKITVDKIENL